MRRNSWKGLHYSAADENVESGDFGNFVADSRWKKMQMLMRSGHERPHWKWAPEMPSNDAVVVGKESGIFKKFTVNCWREGGIKNEWVKNE